MPHLLEGKNFCFVSSRTGYIGADGIHMDWANASLIQALREQFSQLSVAIFSDPIFQRHYTYNLTVDHVYKLPFPFSYLGGMRNVFGFYRILKRIERENDVIIAQLPFVGFLALFFLRKPVVYHLCANVRTAAENPFKYKGITRFIATSFAAFMHRSFQILFARRRTRLIVNGVELGILYRKYDPTVVVSSSLSIKEYISSSMVRRREPAEKLNLLFIGRPSREKGFPTLMKAFAALVENGHPVALTLVGVSKVELEKVLGLQEREYDLSNITFHSFIPWGEQFKQIIRSSHCLILSSVSEGTPRVLIEARSQGCPVIATRIGGVLSSVDDKVDGLLFPPGDHKELVSSVLIMFDETFRLELAMNGLQTARKFNLEAFAQEFVMSVKSLV